MFDTLEEVVLSIKDSVGDLPFYQAHLAYQHHETRVFRQGYYLHYRLTEFDLDRALFLGTEPKAIQKAYNLFRKRWDHKGV